MVLGLVQGSSKLIRSVTRGGYEEREIVGAQGKRSWYLRVMPICRSSSPHSAR